MTYGAEDINKHRYDRLESVSEVSVKSWLPLWIVISLTWGCSFLFIKVAGTFLDPFQQTFARLALGSIVLMPFLLITKRKFITDKKALSHLLFLSIVAHVIPFSLFAWAEHYLTSIAASLINSMLALWVALFAVWFLPEEKLNRTKFFGLLLGFFGIMILLGVWEASFQGNWLAYTACVIATVGYAIANIWTRKFISPMKLDPVSATVAQLSIGATILGIISSIVSTTPSSYPVDGVVAILLLGVVGTGVAFALNLELINRSGSIISSTTAYSMPIVATIAGIIFLSEKLNWYEPIGIILALFGIAITQGLLKSRNSAKAAE